MLSMSSDTLGSSASREWTTVDYGPSRSSTPDSSASSRLAAQLERSAYRRSRSKSRRRQNSNNSNVDTRKPSRSKRIKNQQNQRNQDDHDVTKKNGLLLVVDGSQKSTARRKFASDDDEKQLAASDITGMNNARLSNTDHYKERVFTEPGDDTIVTAYPVSSYSVSCVAVEQDNRNPRSLNYNTEDFPQANNKDVVMSRPVEPAHSGLVNGTDTECRYNGVPLDQHGRRTTNDFHFDKSRNPTVGVSKVRYEECWEDTPKKPAYKAGDNPTIISSSMEEQSPSKSNYGTNSDKSNMGNNLPETIDRTPIVHSHKRCKMEDKRINTVVKCTSVSDEDDNANNVTRRKDNSVHPNGPVKRQAAENSRVEESKPLKLRQLIKIHEVQIAEVAKSAASMKKHSDKFQEGRLVKVKVVAETENKQTYMKRHAAKVPVPRNETSFDGNDVTGIPVRTNHGQRSDVTLSPLDPSIPVRSNHGQRSDVSLSTHDTGIPVRSNHGQRSDVSLSTHDTSTPVRSNHGQRNDVSLSTHDPSIPVRSRHGQRSDVSLSTHDTGIPVRSNHGQRSDVSLSTHDTSTPVRSNHGQRNDVSLSTHDPSIPVRSNHGQRSDVSLSTHDTGTQVRSNHQHSDVSLTTHDTSTQVRSNHCQRSDVFLSTHDTSTQVRSNHGQHSDASLSTHDTGIPVRINHGQRSDVSLSTHDPSIPVRSNHGQRSDVSLSTHDPGIPVRNNHGQRSDISLSTHDTSKPVRSNHGQRSDVSLSTHDTSRSNHGQRSDVSLSAYDTGTPVRTDRINDISMSTRDQEFQENETIPNGDDNKMKRHSVEMRRTKPAVVEDQKWKLHTGIGLVGFDQTESRERLEVNGRIPAVKGFELFTNDSDPDIEYMRKQQVEPEMQILDEIAKRYDNVDAKTSQTTELNNVPMFLYEYNETKENKSEEDDIPPERPPLPENFYSSREDIQRPPPILDIADTSSPILPDDAPLNNELFTPLVVSQLQCDVTLPRSLPAVHVSTTAVVEVQDGDVVQPGNMDEERDTVLGNSRTTREMYEERLARINLVPLDKPNGVRRNIEIVSSPCTSLESFVLENNINLNNNAYLEKLKLTLKQMKALAKEKEELETKYELELRDWKRKYEEQHKVANAYQKLEDRYRRRVEELQVALMQCTCSNGQARKRMLLGQLGKRTEPYFFTSQTQSILDETEEWLKEQSLRSENIHNTENLSNNTRDRNGSLSDLTGGTDWALNYKDIDVTTDIDQYNGTSV